jgi:hypothetical protein
MFFVYALSADVSNQYKDRKKNKSQWYRMRNRHIFSFKSLNVVNIDKTDQVGWVGHIIRVDDAK